MKKNLYQDFTLTHDNCDAEPIHRPIAIQGHGHMLVFNRHELSVLYGISESCHDILGISQEKMWCTHASEWLPNKIWERLSKSASSTTGKHDQFRDDSFLFHYCFHSDNGSLTKLCYQVIIHSHEDFSIVEFEPETDSLSLNFSQMQHVTQLFKNCDTPEELYVIAAQNIKNMLQYDRAMIYQFDEDFHGYVVGEAKEESLEPFLGLHYPSTDIPAMARALFLLNKSRMIRDIHQENRMLVFNPYHSGPIPHLNLAMTELRATSPIHIEYLDNMGVQASLTLAIVIDGKLWGLVACHHYSPRAITYDDRKLGETIADAFSAALVSIESTDTQRRVRQYTLASEAVLNKIRINDHYKIELLDDCSLLMELAECDGAAIFNSENSCLSCGVAPKLQAISEIRKWLIQTDATRIYATDNLRSCLPEDIDLNNEIGGMLAARVSEITKTYIFWFRIPQKQIISWAGDPKNAVIVNSDKESNQIFLSPRKSFSKWQEAIEDKSYPWPKHSLILADDLSKTILRKEFERTSNLVLRSKNELEQLVYSASHDLQEPIRTQLNYLSMMQEDINEAEPSDLLFYIERSLKAANRMQLLIKDLLDYSRLGVRQERSALDLNTLIDEIKDDLEESLTEHKAKILVRSPLPTIIGARSEIKQLFQNLITNAIKYVHPNIEPLIEISLEKDGDFIKLLFKDNGIGIDKRYFDKIFQMFQRLHNNEEYEGTGIGLALCKKVADSYDAKISIESTENVGSTFIVRFHKNYFKEE